MPSLRNLADRSLTDLPRMEKTKGVTRALNEILLRDEMDKAFRRYGPALAGIEEVFPDGRSKARRQWRFCSIQTYRSASDHACFGEAGRVLAGLGRDGIGKEHRRQIVNDVLIAVTSVKAGVIVVTANASDFSLIEKHTPVGWMPPR